MLNTILDTDVRQTLGQFRRSVDQCLKRTGPLVKRVVSDDLAPGSPTNREFRP